MVAVAALERRRGRLFLAVCGDQGRVHIKHHDIAPAIAQVGAGDLRGGDPTGRGELGPDTPTDPGPGPLDPAQRGRGQLGQCPPHRGRGRDRPQYGGLVAQHVDVGDGLTAVSKQHRDIDQHPAAVTHRAERGPRRRLRQRLGQPDPVRQQAGGDTAGVTDHPGPVSRDRQPR